MNGETAHTSVLSKEICDILLPGPNGIFVDATFGAGGHARRFLEQGASFVYAIDQDETVRPFVDALATDYPQKLSFHLGNFSHLTTLLPETAHGKVSGILFDLGVSSMQLDQSERGFSFMRDGPLDMRMSGKGPSAQEAINQLSEQELADIFYYYGEERRSRQIAAAICLQRRTTPFTTTLQLAQAVSTVLGGRTGKIHPATRVFQGLRIYVNQELDILASAFTEAAALLIPGGKLAVITFHSLEDRLVKRLFKSLSLEHDQFHILTKKPVAPTEAETRVNPRSRSAKLRILQKKLAVDLVHDDALRTPFDNAQDASHSHHACKESCHV